jgi:hypothetical protein
MLEGLLQGRLEMTNDGTGFGQQKQDVVVMWPDGIIKAICDA